MKEDFLYYGLTIDKSIYNRLMSSLLNNSNTSQLIEKSKKVFLHHCTLMFKSQLNDETLPYKQLLDANLGKKFFIKIIGIGVSDKAMAFRVELENIKSINTIPHITICTFNDGKPVDSNFITDWIPIDEFSIETTLEKF